MNGLNRAALLWRHDRLPSLPRPQHVTWREEPEHLRQRSIAPLLEQRPAIQETSWTESSLILLGQERQYILERLVNWHREVAMKVTGSCHCETITYEAEVDPATVRVCHCTDCQKLTGSVFRATIPSLPGTFRLRSGIPKIYVKTAESGNKRYHAFCPDCGTPIYATSPEPNPSIYGLRVGGLDQRAQLAPPTRQQWCRSALAWSMDISNA